MPYKSQAQAGYFHTHEKELAKQGVDVGEWDKATKGKKLPKKVGYDGGDFGGAGSSGSWQPDQMQLLQSKFSQIPPEFLKMLLPMLQPLPHGQSLGDVMGHDGVHYDANNPTLGQVAQQNQPLREQGVRQAPPQQATQQNGNPAMTGGLQQTPPANPNPGTGQTQWPGLPPAQANSGTPGTGDYQTGGQSGGQNPFGSYGQTLGYGMNPWDVPYQSVGGQFTSPLDPVAQHGIQNMDQFANGGMGMGGATNYLNNVLSGQYNNINQNPALKQIQDAMQQIKNIQDQQAQAQIGSAMAAGGNALSGARAASSQNYQNLSNANFNNTMGNLLNRNYEMERGFQNQAPGQLGSIANLLQSGYGNQIGAGMIPTNLANQNNAMQYEDWKRTTGNMFNDYTNQNQTFNNLIHGGYPSTGQPNYAESGIAGLAALLGGGSGGGGLLGNNGSLYDTSGGGNGIINQLLQAFGIGGGGNNGNPTGQPDYSQQFGPNPPEGFVPDTTFQEPDYSQMFGPGNGDPNLEWLQGYGGDPNAQNYFGGGGT